MPPIYNFTCTYFCTFSNQGGTYLAERLPNRFSYKAWLTPATAFINQTPRKKNPCFYEVEDVPHSLLHGLLSLSRLATSALAQFPTTKIEREVQARAARWSSYCPPFHPLNPPLFHRSRGFFPEETCSYEIIRAQRYVRYIFWWWWAFDGVVDASSLFVVDSIFRHDIWNTGLGPGFSERPDKASGKLQ